jgi:hypothetical protein
MSDDVEDESQGFDIVTHIVATNYAIDVGTGTATTKCVQWLASADNS